MQQCHGFGLHAATEVEANDRDRLIKLCRYVQRPTLAADRLKSLDDGRFYYAFKRVWKNGAKGIYFDGPDLIERLSALIPPPRKNTIRYHGAFAPRSKLNQALKVWVQAQRKDRRKALSHKQRVYWLLLSELLKRTFKVDVQRCPNCGSRMEHISLIKQPDVIDLLLAYAEEPRGPPS